jgi:hypothetical protein
MQTAERHIFDHKMWERVAPAAFSSPIAFHRYGLLLITFPLQSAQYQYSTGVDFATQ